jgi:hypothetical protein
VSGRPELLHRAAFAILDSAADALAEPVPDVQTVIASALAEFSSLGATDRARVAGRLAVTAAQLHRCLLQFLPAREVDALMGRDLMTLDGPLAAPRKDDHP